MVKARHNRLWSEPAPVQRDAPRGPRKASDAPEHLVNSIAPVFGAMAHRTAPEAGALPFNSPNSLRLQSAAWRQPQSFFASHLQRSHSRPSALHTQGPYKSELTTRRLKSF